MQASTIASLKEPKFSADSQQNLAKALKIQLVLHSQSVWQYLRRLIQLKKWVQLIKEVPETMSEKFV